MNVRTLVSTSHPVRLLTALFPLLMTMACASAPPQLGSAAPEPEEEGNPKDGPTDLDYCEDLFSTLNSFDSSAQAIEAIVMAEAAGRDNAEGCRQAFLAAASSPGSKVIANVFADLMLVRSFELGLDRRARQQDIEGVCPETQAALTRIESIRDRATQTLAAPTELKDHERGVLAQVASNMADKQSALEPFFLRGCKNGSFDPGLFVSVDDLQVGATMTPDQCRDVLVAMAAFDLEQAPPDELAGLLDKLKRAVPPCRKAMLTPEPIEDLSGLEALNQIDLLESSPVMIAISMALSRNEVPAACAQMRVYIDQVEARQERLTRIIKDKRTPDTVQKEARIDLDMLVYTLRSFSREYTNLCAL
ncbi:MAG: hypothetical protein AAFX99_23050 [Myxococcota bacterium]